MSSSRRGKRNKNGDVQFSETKLAPSTYFNFGRKFEDGKATPCEEQPPAHGLNELHVSNCTLRNTDKGEYVRATVKHTSKDELLLDEELRLDEEPGNVETDSWLRNTEEKAEINTCLEDYSGSNARDTHTCTKHYRNPNGNKKSVLKMSVPTPQRKTEYGNDKKRQARFKGTVDPSVPSNKQSSHGLNGTRKNKNATESAKTTSNDGHAKDDIIKQPDRQFSNKRSGQIVKPKRNNNNYVPSSKINGNSSVNVSNDSKTSVHGHKPTSRYKQKLLETPKTFGDLALEEGFVMKDVDSDGNCLFAAIVDQLYIRGEFYFSTRSLREAAVIYLTEHPYQEDGTPLKHFFTEQDGTWEEYLARMSCDGEWGDHFVISAITNVLQRRLVVMRGVTELTSTIMEPNKGNNSPHSKTTSKNLPGTSASQDVSRGEQGMRQGEQGRMMNDLYLGHIAQSHYVSLRHYNWSEQFQDCSRRRSLPSFLHYNQGHEIGRELALTGDIQEAGHTKQQTFPEEYLNFLLRSVKTAELFTEIPFDQRIQQSAMCITFWVGDVVCGLKAITNGPSIIKDTNKLDADVKLYVVPNDTIVMVLGDEEVGLSPKDLVAKEKDCPQGFTLLSPVKESMWTKAIVKVNGEVYLKHLFFNGDREFNTNLIFAFKCKWPHCSSEFLDRQRPYCWPTTFQIQEIQKHGVHVVPEVSSDSNYPTTEWKFSFRNAENILCRGMVKQMKYGYYVLKIVHDFLFEYKGSLNDRYLKAVFFFTCEELPQQEFGERPWYCLLYMLRKLQTHLQKGFLPDFFVREENLIAHMEEAVLLWHVDQLEWFQTNPVEGLFLFLDRYEVMELFGLRKCFETLITDAQKFVTRQSVRISYRERFLPLSIALIQNMVKDRKHENANDLCESLFEECTGYFDSFDGPENILHKVLDGVPLQEQWLFAFYMDLMKGSYLMETVCTGRECVPLATYFGDGLTQELEAISTGPVHSLKVPVTIVYKENLVAFAYSFSNMLLDCDTQSYKTAVHFFLKTFTNEVLHDIVREELNGDYHTGHADTKRKLDSMFLTLYDKYDQESALPMFQDLMEMYDLLSRNFNNSSLNNHVARLWNYFRDIDK